jgi:hypothetical protein
MASLEEMNLVEALEEFPDVNRNIILKSDMIRLGINFSKKALEEAKKLEGIRFKGFSIFSFDFGKTTLREQKIPYVSFIDDGTEFGMAVQSRMSDNTPYLIDFEHGKFVVKWNGEKMAEIMRFSKRGDFATRLMDDGTPFESFIYVGGGDCALHVVLTKYCSYFAKDEQCMFCNFVPHAQTQRKAGETVVTYKDPEKVADVLFVALDEKLIRHVLVSGGTFETLQGKAELDWYCDHLEIMKRRIRQWPESGLQISPQDDDGWQKIADIGIGAVETNFEVWPKRLFKIVCPGKNRRVGFDEWIKRTINAVKYFGPGNVNPNFVLGVEMAKPFGFEKVEDAVKSTLEGWDLLLGNGVVPRTDHWCIEPESKLAGQTPPPLAYYILVQKGAVELREKHGFGGRVASVHCRHCECNSTDHDWEYFHGHSLRSKWARETANRLVEG